MRSRGRRGTLAATALGTILAVVAASGWMPARSGPAAAPSGGGAQRAPHAADSAVHQVTLLTGDKVMVRTRPGGAPSAQVVRGPGRTRMPYSARAYGGHLFVEPADAQRLIAAGRLDERLFDVTQLVAQGYDDAHTPDIPVITEGTGHAAAAVPDAHGTLALPALGMAATRIRKAGATAAWRTLTGGAARPATFAASTSAKKVWLDGRLRLADDVSAAQIGAPAAWNSGLTGAGVTVAVLDSGYDATHPDLTGVVTQSQGFTDAGAADVTDRVGHGTHVASILAGSGAASDGRFQGIAHGAKLAVGKVCDNTGRCDTSWVLAGMTWAAKTVKARVVNMSLGAPDAPGIDPLEDAVNTLTQQTGTLFVIAAGNEGADSTIESPGSADAALTVGAVDSTDALAPFSSRGPRLDDFAIKPDLTAPGVDITAARAAGSDLGTPVDTAYQKLSGTSMATPHAAGAAAIVAQQHPDWTAARIKAALTSSAKPATGATAYQEGDGRLDIARAISQPVTAAPAGVSAYLKWPHAAGQAAAKTYTYSNAGTAPIGLSLAVRATGPGGAAAPAGLFRLGQSAVTVPAGGTADVTVTITADGVAPGVYSGLVTATSADGAVVARTGVGAYVEPEAEDVTVTATGRDGSAADTTVDFFDPATGTTTEAMTSGGTATLRLLAKPYAVYAAVVTQESSGATSVSSLMRPFTVGQNSHDVALDARAAKPVTVTIDRPDAVVALTAMTTYNGTGGAFVGLAGGGAGQVFVLPVKDANLVFNAQSVWTQQGATEAAPGSFRYDLADVDRGEVPADPTFAHLTADLASIKATARSADAPGIGSLVWAPVLPDVFLSFGTGVPMRLPAAQAEFVTPQVTYSRSLFYGSSDETLLQSGMLDATPAAYEAGGESAETWNAAVTGPAFLTSGGARTGDAFTYSGDGLFSDAESGHVGRDGRATGTIELDRGGTVVASGELRGGLASLAATLPASTATYTLKVSARRQAADAALSTGLDTVWTFGSGHTASQQALPLLAARFAVPGLGDDNRAAAGATVSLPVQVIRNPGAPSSAVSGLTVQASNDDGKTWQTVPVAASGDGWLATVSNPASGFVSLRASAADGAGDSVVQTIIRAYAVR
ncbi:MAG TPA: S8 family serine peptidase [Streptosporangiaceae bacterium]